MATDHDGWQRLAPVALVFLFLKNLQKFIRENLYAFAGAGAGFAFIDWLGPRELVLAIVGVLAVLIGGTVIYFRRFSFCIEGDAVRVRSGVFERKELRVRFARIQNIQIGQPIYFRPFGLVRFSLETPGANDREVDLPGIGRDLAEDMRNRIVSHQQLGDVEAPPETAAPSALRTELYHAPIPRLLLHGMASNQVWVLAGVLAYLTGTLLDRLSQRLEEAEAVVAVMERFDNGWLLLMAAIPVVLVVLVGVSALVAVLRYHGFSLEEEGERLVARHGLLEQREQTVRREKVTGLVLRQSAVGRLLGCWALVVRQTRSSDAEEQAERGGFLVPGLAWGECGISARILADAAAPVVLSPISARFRRVLWQRWFVVLLAVLAACSMIWYWGHWSTVLAAALMPLFMGMLHLRFRHWGWHRSGEMLWVRQGMLGQRIDGFRLDRVQQVRIVQSLYQRRHDLATLQLIVPQGSVSIPFMTLEAASGLANEAAFVAETALEHRV
jgi:putative membrane protein